MKLLLDTVTIIRIALDESLLSAVAVGIGADIVEDADDFHFSDPLNHGCDGGRLDHRAVFQDDHGRQNA